MDDLFQHLEARVKALVSRCEQLEHENISLRQSKSFLAREKDLLLERNRAVISEIETMVSNFKSAESLS